MRSGFLFFAYGRHMDPDLMAELHPDCESMGRARADGQKLCFNAAGEANLRPEPGAAAWGILWLVPAERMADLDRWAQDRGLARGVVFIISPAGPRVPATAYLAPAAVPGAPDVTELERLLRVARAARFDPGYQAELAGWAAAH